MDAAEEVVVAEVAVPLHLHVHGDDNNGDDNGASGDDNASAVMPKH